MLRITLIVWCLLLFHSHFIESSATVANDDVVIAQAVEKYHKIIQQLTDLTSDHDHNRNVEEEWQKQPAGRASSTTQLFSDCVEKFYTCKEKLDIYKSAGQTSAKELIEYKVRISALERELEQYKSSDSTIYDMRKLIAEQTEELKTKNSQLKDQGKQLNLLKNDLGVCNSALRNSNNHKAYRICQDKLSACQKIATVSDRATCSSDLLVCQNDATNAQNTISVLNQQLTTCQISPTNSTDSENCKNDAMNCKTDLDNCKNGAANTVEELSTCKSDLNACKTTATDCKTNFEACETNAMTCKGDLSTCQADASSCKTNFEAFQTNAMTCKTDLDTCKTDASTTHDSLTNCISNATDAATKITTLHSDFTTCNTSLVSCQSSTCPSDLAACMTNASSKLTNVRTLCNASVSGLSLDVSPDGRIYYFHNNQATGKNWHGANKFCHSKGMELVSMESINEYTWVKSKVQSYLVAANVNFSTNSVYWTSLNSNEVAGTWVWEGSGVTTSYTDWKSTPTGNTKRCGMITWPSDGTLGWVADSCTAVVARFICEMADPCTSVMI